MSTLDDVIKQQEKSYALAWTIVSLVIVLMIIMAIVGFYSVRECQRKVDRLQTNLVSKTVQTINESGAIKKALNAAGDLVVRTLEGAVAKKEQQRARKSKK